MKTCHQTTSAVKRKLPAELKCSKENTQSRLGKLQKQHVRIPRDYPWKVLSALNQGIGAHLAPKLRQQLEEVISTRNVDRYLGLADTWGLQSINSECDPDYRGNHEVRIMLASVMKKYQFLGDSEARKRAAIETVLQGERDCSAFNRKGRRVLKHSEHDPVFKEARRFIARVLGPDLPTQEIITKRARHGPGASTGSISGFVTKYDKYSHWPYDVTAGCLPHARKLIEADERWMAALDQDYRAKHGMLWFFEIDRDLFWSRVFTIVDGNKITTVPKNARTERSIAIEPEMNMMLQLGVDGFVRKRLKRWGINLDDQSKNQKLAYEGSLRSDFLSPCTLDLQSASDTISLGIAKSLLPEPWFRYMCDIRSPIGTLPDGKRLRFSKLSSMGNGDTFAVESLIFASLLFGACKATLGYYPRKMVSIFGDDIVCPEVTVPVLVRYLELSGFRLNLTKSFLSGDVKESCGTDWFRGYSMRPVHIDCAPTVVAELYSDRNRLLRWLHLNEYATLNAVEALDSLYQKWIPDYLMVKGPYSDTEFDTYWHDDCSSWRMRSDGTYRGRCLSTRYRTRKLCYDPLNGTDDFLFGSLAHNLVGNGHNKPMHWMTPLQISVLSGSVFSVYDTNSIRRGVNRQRKYWPSQMLTEYTSARDLLFNKE